MIDPYNASWELWLQKWFAWLLAPAILINAGGLLIPILEPDGALYATIAKTIAQSGDFIHLRVEGKDWLDKPHFPFWMAALSYRIFGITAFSYKFPALLFWAMGGWYTYRLAYSVYGRPVAQLATLIYVSAAHLVISNNDVRAEPYLTGLVIGSVYHFYRASLRFTGGGFRKEWSWHLVAGSLLAGCAVMTKGPFVLITIGSGLILDWIRRRDWKQFRSARWWIALVLTAVFILPELYCLYIQFDLHPEKQVFGRTGVSGIRFFFWDSQFGRFFNTGPIRGSGDPLFYFHTVLWAFLPWSLLLYASVVQKCRRIRSGYVRAGDGRGQGAGGFDEGEGRDGDGRGFGEGEGRDGDDRAYTGDRAIPGDIICLGAALSSFLIFSLSRFQLPHYLNILFPFFSILTAGYLYGIQRKRAKQLAGVVQAVITVALVVLPLALCYFFHFRGWVFVLVTLLALSLLAFRFFRGMSLTDSVGRSYWIALLAYGFVNFCLYPALLRYQAGEAAGEYIRGMEGAPGRTVFAGSPDAQQAVESDPNQALRPVYTLQEAPANYSFEFYCPRPVKRISLDSLSAIIRQGPTLVFMPASFADSLTAGGHHTTILQRFPDFHVSQLTGEFIDFRTRSSVLSAYWLIRISF